MSHLKTYRLPEQVANYLRKEIAAGRWQDEIPGRDFFAEELGVSPRSVLTALEMLEKEGILVPQGQGRRRMVNRSAVRPNPRNTRVAVLYYTSLDLSCEYELRHRLEQIGYSVVFTPRGLYDLGMNVSRVQKMVRDVNADLWIVYAASKEVLQWFIDNEIKVFAIAGRRLSLPIAGAGPNKAEVYKQVTQTLIEKGHSRIVLLCARHLRVPNPSLPTMKFLEALIEGGILPGEYNLPDWEESAEGLQSVLGSLFKTTPPTALILDQPILFHAAYHFLARRDIKVPEDVSMICTDPDPDFKWCRPRISHIYWDERPVVRRILKWVDNMARGVDDRRQSFTKAEFVPGETVSDLKNKAASG